MEYYNNILCISKPELTPEIMSDSAYDQYVYRNPHVRVRQGKGANTHALLAYDQLRFDIKKSIREILFNGKDPHQVIKHDSFEKHIKHNQEARDFYKTYLFDNDRPLPDDKQIEYYNNAIILNAANEVYLQRRTMRKKLNNPSTGIWDSISDDVNSIDKTSWSHSLPRNKDYLRKLVNNYLREGYAFLISAKFNNKNSEKINEAAKLWLLSLWANMIERIPNEEQLLKKYNERASQEGWKQLSCSQSIHNFLYSEEIQSLWYSHRYGELKEKERSIYQHSTLLPSMRDSLWYSDGTKLNYFYLTDEGKIDTCQVYEIIDAYSECFLGYNISKSENYASQYRAYKMAMQFAGYKPYQIQYDNQGGHKKLENSDFLKKLAHLAINTAPYNGKSKTIENAFSRFQGEFLKKDWFFTGQNIQAKRIESKANIEFVMQNKANLPTLNEIKKIYEQRRNEWNAAPHPKTNQARIEMYKNSINPNTHKVELDDLVDMFWLTREKPITCSAYGITFQENNEKFTYMVNTSDGLPNITWLKSNIDKQFIIKFDPEDTSMIYLYENTPSGLRFVIDAHPKVEIHRGKQEQEEWEAEFIKKVDIESKRVRIESRDKMDAILELHNMLPEQHGLVSPTLKGIENRKKRARKVDIATVEKVISNATLLDDEDINYKEMY